jgi:hypothetical protein
MTGEILTVSGAMLSGAQRPPFRQDGVADSAFGWCPKSRSGVWHKGTGSVSPSAFEPEFARGHRRSQGSYPSQPVRVVVPCRIINEVRGINRVTYDITSKPPKSSTCRSASSLRRWARRSVVLRARRGRPRPKPAKGHSSSLTEMHALMGHKLGLSFLRSITLRFCLPASACSSA